MTSKQPNVIFFIGIGGIGMSALARYYLAMGCKVFGYDKTKSDLTESLTREGAIISYEEVWQPHQSFNKDSMLVIYTPAISAENGWYKQFKLQGFQVIKRAQALGEITRNSSGLCVAGTHGKSTTSAMLAFLLHESALGCSAFLGAIATNFENNVLINAQSRYTVIEADEYDRSFLNLSPFASIITNIDPDHLDIYESEEKFYEGFRQFAMKVDPLGFLVLKEGLHINALCKKKTYALNSNTADYTARNITETPSGARFDLVTPTETLEQICIGINGSHNVENALAALALCDGLGLNLGELAHKFQQFKGIKRRFEKIYSGKNIVFIDDYAHHPTEINRLISSVRHMYPNQRITGVFQPHLFSRTRDFGDAFGYELGQLDSVILLPIYPARELPIQGIDSNWLLQKIKNPNKRLLNPSELLEYLRSNMDGVLLTIGAGDIDRMVDPIRELLQINDSAL
ncbi:MAG: UDP-N-acetylmuramate--L-alanine ligase [Flavobacteriales bacterium]